MLGKISSTMEHMGNGKSQSKMDDDWGTSMAMETSRCMTSQTTLLLVPESEVRTAGALLKVISGWNLEFGFSKPINSVKNHRESLPNLQKKRQTQQLLTILFVLPKKCIPKIQLIHPHVSIPRFPKIGVPLNHPCYFRCSNDLPLIQHP